MQQNLETFLAHEAEADPMGEGVPFWVENDFRTYLHCGILPMALRAPAARSAAASD